MQRRIVAVLVAAAGAAAATAVALGPASPAGATTSVLGEGPDELTLQVSEDAYQGDAPFTVAVDGRQIGDELTATASHAAGDHDTVTVRGDWAAGDHQLRVTFLADAWGGSPDTDRNLYLDSVAYQGTAIPDSARDLYGTGWTGDVTFTDQDAPAEPAFVESFDSGVGALAHTWGDTSRIDTSVPGQVSVSGTAGFMEWPSGPEAGHGYGTFEMVARMAGDKPGPALVLWPADDQWPGQEFDLGEILDGRPYLTTHWNEDGHDAYNSHFADGVDESQWHTYAVRWEPGKLTYTVDGAVVGTDTEHVPADFAHGGKNDVFGGMNRPGDDTSLTLGEVRWTPLG